MTINEVLEEINFRKNAKCCIIFPSAYSKFFSRVVPNFLRREIDLDYIFFAYDNFDKKAANSVIDACRDSCILVIAYKGKIELEHSYKLGIAHAFNVCVVLIDLQKESIYSLPEYIKYNFIIRLISLAQKQDIDNLLKKIREVIVVSLSRNTIEILYEEARSICALLEENLSLSIDKVDKKTFIQRLTNEDISVCFNNYEAAYDILLERIVLDEISLAHVYIDAGAFLSKIKEDQMSKNDKITWIGDRVDGDKVIGDKDTVAGNKMKTGDVAGDAIAGNKIVNTQNMTQTAQDIKILVNQYASDYDTTTQSGKMGLSGKVIESIEQNPTLKSRTLNALKEAGKTAFEEAIDHPIAKVLVAGLEGFME